MSISAGLAAVSVRMRQLLAQGKMLGPGGVENPLGWEPCPCPRLQCASQDLQARNCCSLRKLLLSPAHEDLCWCSACCWHLWEWGRCAWLSEAVCLAASTFLSSPAQKLSSSFSIQTLMAPFGDKVSPSSPKSAAGRRKLSQMLLFLCGVKACACVTARPQRFSMTQTLTITLFYSKDQALPCLGKFVVAYFFSLSELPPELILENRLPALINAAVGIPAQTFLYRIATSSDGC